MPDSLPMRHGPSSRRYVHAEEIRIRAYQIFQANRHTKRDADQDWFEAERELGKTGERRKLTPLVIDLLRSLLRLSRTSSSPDSHDNPVVSRPSRILDLRIKLVQALDRE